MAHGASGPVLCMTGGDERQGLGKEVHDLGMHLKICLPEYIKIKLKVKCDSNVMLLILVLGRWRQEDEESMTIFGCI